MVTAPLIQDILSNNKKLDMDAVLPFIILPLLLLAATLSRTFTIVVMVFIGMGTLYVVSRPRKKNRSKFFYSWTLSSAITMYLVYELGVLKLLEITMLENAIFLLLLACTCFFFYKMKKVADFELATGSSKGKEYSPVLTSDSHYCDICQIEVNERFFHSIWWDCCVLSPNYPYFLAGQFFALATLLVGTNFGLTSVCQPYISNIDYILLPENCDEVYYEFLSAICFVACVYGVGYICVIGLVLIYHLVKYIPKYGTIVKRRINNRVRNV